LNKKGSIPDLVLMMVLLLVFVIVSFLALKLLNQFGDSAESEILESETAQAIVSGGQSSIGLLDNLFVYLVIGLAVGVIALAYMLNVPTIYYPLGIIALIFIVTIAAIFSNVSDEFTSDDTFAANESVELSLMPTIMNNLPLWISIIGIIVLIVLFAKGRVWQQ